MLHDAPNRRIVARLALNAAAILSASVLTSAVCAQGFLRSPAINIGTAHYRRGEYEEALYFYEAALTTRLALPPLSRAGLFSNVAVTHAMLGHDEQARAFIGRSLAEKEYGINQVGVYLAFCKGRSERLEGFDPALVRQAQSTVESVTRLLSTHQPALHEAGAFCPEREVPAP